MPVRAVLFDLFDTLVDLYMENLPLVQVDGKTVRHTTPALHAAAAERSDVDFDTFATALAAVDRELRLEREGQGRELPTLERFGALADRLGIDDPELPRILTQTHMQRIRSAVRAVPHHADVLAELGRRYRLGVCSNFSHAPTAEEVLEEAGLACHFECVTISEQVGYRKPRPEIFRACLEQLGVAAADTVHVGDRLVADVLGASELGIRSCWLTRRVKDPAQALADYAGPAPSWTVSDLAELPEILDRG